MTKRKLSKKEREEVRRIFEDQRTGERCKIVKRLSSEAKEITGYLDEEIKNAEKALGKLNAERSRLLKEACLVDFDKVNTRGYCVNYILHPDLSKYDEETSRMLIELLTEEEIPIDVKSILTKVLE